MDARTRSIVDFLTRRGAARVPHRGGRSLLDHLVGCHAIARRWEQPQWLAHAALVHSVYGSESFPHRLLALSDRSEIAAVAGARAERLAFLFSVTPRAPLFAGTHRWARDLPAPSAELSREAPPAGDTSAPTPEEHDALVLLHMVNLAEQRRSADGSPGHWLAWTGRLAELLVDRADIHVPAALASLAELSSAQESTARRAYRSAVQRGDDVPTRTSRLALAATLCPVVAEPCAWLAHLALAHGDAVAAAAWAQEARARLRGLGTAWDKRLSIEEWEALIDAVERGEGATSATGSIRHPRELYQSVSGTVERPRPAPAVERPRPAPGDLTPEDPPHPPDATAGRARFHRYVDSLADTAPPVLGLVYPDLPRRPWHEPGGLRLAADLEANFAAVRDEIARLDPTRFHRESERIERSGSWDVAFFYERGQRRDEVCDACPVTAEIIERHRTMRTVGGLIYASRMRPGTHIAAHRGPTNLRLRCHLGIAVPDGDCAIRVGEQTRRWAAGKCLIFDDFCEHEAWNHTEADRVVLIVDVWHPGLSDTEVSLLEGLQRYAYAQARTLGRYWAANAAAAQVVRAGD